MQYSVATELHVGWKPNWGFTAPIGSASLKSHTHIPNGVIKKRHPGDETWLKSKRVCSSTCVMSTATTYYVKTEILETRGGRRRTGGVFPLDSAMRMRSYISLSQKLICGFQANMVCCQWQFDFCISRSQRSGRGRGSACISPMRQGWALPTVSFPFGWRLPVPSLGVGGRLPFEKQNSDTLKGSCWPLLAGSRDASWTVGWFCKARRQKDCVTHRLFTKG